MLFRSQKIKQQKHRCPYRLPFFWLHNRDVTSDTCHGLTISSADCLRKLNHAQKVGQLYRSSDASFTVTTGNLTNKTQTNKTVPNRKNLVVLDASYWCSDFLSTTNCEITSPLPISKPAICNINCQWVTTIYASSGNDYICLKTLQQIAIIDYLFATHFHGMIVSLLDIYRENLCTETCRSKIDMYLKMITGTSPDRKSLGGEKKWAILGLQCTIFEIWSKIYNSSLLHYFLR